MGNTADAHAEGKKVKREDEPCVFHLGGKIGWVDRGGSEPHKWSNLPVVKRFREDHVTKGRQKRMPNKAGCRRDRRRAGALFSRRAGQTKDPRIFLAANIPSRRPTAAMTANPMDSAVGRISRVNGLAIRFARPPDTICYGISRYCLLGVVAPTPESWSRLGYLKLPSSRTGLEISLLGITFFLAFRRNK